MSNFYLIDGFWKDSDLCFNGELVTDGGNYDVECKYSHDDIFAYGFNPDNLDDKDSEFVVTRYVQISKNISYDATNLSTFRRRPYQITDPSSLDIVRVSTSSWEEEDFYVLSTLEHKQIKAIISPMVTKEREANELLYDNEDYIIELRKAYPTHRIEFYANFDTIKF